MKAAGLADKSYLSKHDLETITDISAGAATFFVWVNMFDIFDIFDETLMQCNIM